MSFCKDKAPTAVVVLVAADDREGADSNPSSSMF